MVLDLKLRNKNKTNKNTITMAKATESETGKVYVVTGANKGIGLCIVRGLCKNKGEADVVYLCSR